MNAALGKHGGALEADSRARCARCGRFRQPGECGTSSASSSTTTPTTEEVKKRAEASGSVKSKAPNASECGADAAPVMNPVLRARDPRARAVFKVDGMGLVYIPSGSIRFTQTGRQNGELL